ncbi:response regulator [Spirosoma foliorum]|uniref:Response regulator n=1 Tax=Spirosoma foliorum TaxID=2710596 RepID=A0A7G5H6H4_9BACT|nr:response regulator [Spirosoma foliorum]QMW06716.1 response regulator [Spirosoma foliorum]
MKTTFNILIVDDDEDDQYLIQAAFEKDSARYNLQFAADGTDVLEKIDAHQFLPDLVLLDLNMPRMHGFEVLKHLKDSPVYRHVPVVILTTSDNENDINQAYQLGANTFLTKPLNHQALVDLAEQVRLYWFTLAKTPTRQMNFKPDN